MSRFDELLSKEMTRHQFLVTVGLGIISILGFSALIGAFSSESHSSAMNGYGSRDYGH